ncbi:hypothetical protein [Bifidobacterium sp.]|uniref:hypothetical protein n=1 Tax=Bifidobacterium sp. TaxID=41200 RepID=UPI0039ECEA9B
MGNRKRHRPKSIALPYLLTFHKPALTYDWLTRIGTVYRPLTWEEWQDGTPRQTIPFGIAWQLTAEILKDHTSHTHAALNDWSYLPTTADEIAWAFSDHPKGAKPPWQAMPHAHRQRTPQEQKTMRSKLDATYHIGEGATT